MSDPKADALIAEFASLLDEVLIIALVSDYDLNDPSQLDAARTTLQSLAENVLAEEATGFNPSGTSEAFSLDGFVDAKESSSMSHDYDSTSHAKDSDSTATTLTTPPSDGFTSANPAPRIRSYEGKSEETQVAHLHDMFADLKVHDVKLAFKKADGDFQTTLETLLNLQFLESAGERQKGIDGFFRPDDDRPAKKKRKGKQRRAGSSAITSPTSAHAADSLSPAVSGSELRRLEDILFVAEKLDLPIEEVSSVYSRNGGSRESTILEFLDRYAQRGTHASDAATEARISELSKRYQKLPKHYLSPLVGLVGDIPETVEELAALLDANFSDLPPQRLAISYNLKPLTGEELEELPTTAAGPSSKANKQQQTGLRQPAAAAAAAATSTATILSPAPAPTSRKPPSYEAALDSAARLAASRHHSQAAAARNFRKGASHPLYRAAASVYADRAREETRAYLRARGAVADALVADRCAASRDPDTVDLHGIEVADGVRLALDHARGWWRRLPGEYRARAARESRGLVIITGIGRHCVGGVSRLRQSVAAALVEDGWRVEVETGRFRVMGRR
ncbi:hypothetical protein SODALDRAFT_220460 [Sodiomyces alkalinus F11]|uniref:Smr domain-containing protein n=1 Tax=Sodiomyces alkalinus (strain CBS 110278 / VKM F-3762 / F11) TaxID=1314773 RepID=A0A3N2PPX0_SODAK|nr:hypothetical protein SODALDRAFT_220460 [Sodiomyces alkalinus F11]ROT36490.1 hypothetical protein SODALDRAFT_220460 [Sodiomyces alkalinus F11]